MPYLAAYLLDLYLNFPRLKKIRREGQNGILAVREIAVLVSSSVGIIVEERTTGRISGKRGRIFDTDANDADGNYGEDDYDDDVFVDDDNNENDHGGDSSRGSSISSSRVVVVIVATATVMIIMMSRMLMMMIVVIRIITIVTLKGTILDFSSLLIELRTVYQARCRGHGMQSPCNTSGVSVQHVLCHDVVRRDSSAVSFDRVAITFAFSFIYLADTFSR